MFLLCFFVALLQFCNFTILQWTENGNTWDFICQHGPDECFGNKVQVDFVDFVILLILFPLISIKHLVFYLLDECFGNKVQVDIMILLMLSTFISIKHLGFYLLDECFGMKVQVDIMIFLMLLQLISIKHLGFYFGIKSQVLMIVLMIALIMMIST